MMGQLAGYLARALGPGRGALGLLMAAVLLPDARAQDYWVWPPPPDYYYYPYQPQEPRRTPRRRSSPQRSSSSSSSSSAKERQKAAAAREREKAQKEQEKAREEARKAREREEKKREQDTASARDREDAPEPPSPPPIRWIEVAVDPNLESANPYFASPVDRPGPGAPYAPPAQDRLSRGREISSVVATSFQPFLRSSARAPSGSTVLVWDDSDSLTAIARAAGLTPSELLELNRLSRSSLREGQALHIPQAPDLSAAGADTDRPRAFDPEQQRAREVWRGVRGRNRVALTFDAGSEKDGVDELLDHLEEARVPATFFVTGQFVKKYPDVVRRIAAGGFPIHNHSWSHPEFTKISEEAMRQELERTEQAVAELTGRSTRPYWRPPFGDRDRRVLRTAAAAGYQSIYWTIDSLDSVGETKSPQFIIDRVLNPPKAGGDPIGYLDGAIVLMHVGKPTTAAALPELVRRLREHGFELVTVEEILKP